MSAMIFSYSDTNTVNSLVWSAPNLVVPLSFCVPAFLAIEVAC